MLKLPSFMLSLCLLVLPFFALGAIDGSAQNSNSDSNSNSQPQSAPPNSDAPHSLADVVRGSKAQKTVHAKKTITDEDMEATAGPLPRLRMDGAENADDVVQAIALYKTTHTPEQTEQAVHIWYDRYDEMLAAAIQDNQDTMVLRNANSSNGYELCQESGDYQQCRTRQMAEQRGARSDQAQIMKNNQLEVRIQHAFMKVRNGLAINNLRYEWFKIRTTNGIDQF